MKVQYTGKASDAQVNWGGNDDPRGVLVAGEVYEVERVEPHSGHTKYWIAGRKYNSVHFVAAPQEREGADGGEA